MTEWIYESPDNGKTITRRRHHDREDVKRTMMVEYNTWWDLNNLRDLSRQLAADQKLRDENPILNDLWEQYHIMKNLLGDK